MKLPQIQPTARRSLLAVLGSIALAAFTTLILPGTAQAAITVSTYSLPSAWTTGSPATVALTDSGSGTFTIPPGGGNGMLVVTITGENGVEATATWGGVAMTKVTSKMTGTGNGAGYSAIFYLALPASGTGPLAVTYSGNRVCAYAVYATGVNATPEGSALGGDTLATTTIDTTNPPSITPSAGALVVTAYGGSPAGAGSDVVSSKIVKFSDNSEPTQTTPPRAANANSVGAAGHMIASDASPLKGRTTVSVTGGNRAITIASFAPAPPPVFDHLAVTETPPHTAGVPFEVTITGLDINDVIVNNSSATITVSSLSTFMEFDWNRDGIYGDNSGTLAGGTTNILARNKKAETTTITAVGGGASTTSPPSVTTDPAAFAKLQILAPGETAAPGTTNGRAGTPIKQAYGYSFNYTVNAVDTNWNVVNSVFDTVGITATDATATLPPAAGLGGGTGTFAVTLNTNGTFTLTASDVTDNTKTPGTVVVTAVNAAIWNLDLSLKTFTNNTGTAAVRTNLANAGLEADFTGTGDRAVAFDTNGAHFGPLNGAWFASRNYLKTLEDYANVSFTAYITINRTNSLGGAAFGIGGGRQGNFGEPDYQLAGSSSIVFWSGAIRLNLNGSTTTLNSFPLAVGADLGRNILRIRMVYDAVAKTVVFAGDNAYTGLSFAPDWTSPAYDLVALGVAAEWASGDISRIFFGGDADNQLAPAPGVGIAYTDFKVTTGLSAVVPVSFGATTPGGSSAWMTPVVSASVIDGNVATVVDSSLKLYQDAVLVATNATRVETNVFIAYTNSTPLSPGSTHTNMLTCTDSEGKNFTNFWVWTVFNYKTIPASYALATPATTPGLLVKTFATDNTGPGPKATLGIIAAEQQIAGGLKDASGNLYPNLAVPSSGSDSNVNWNLVAGVDAGNFNSVTAPAGQYTDREFLGVNQTSLVADNFSTEVNAYLRLAAGYYRMIVNSDDGFKVSVAPGLGNPDGTVLGGFLTGQKGASDVSVDFYLPVGGDYPFRLLYYQGSGGASAEWIIQNVTTGEKVLINDESNTNAVLAFQTGSSRATLTRMLPANGFGSAAANQGVEFQITDGRTARTGTPTLLVNGSPVTPSIVSGGGLTTITWSPAGNFPFGSTNTAQLVWTENTTPSPTLWTNRTTFTVKQASLVDMPLGTPWIEAGDFNFGSGQMVPAANDFVAYNGTGYQAATAWGDPYFPIFNVDYFNFLDQGAAGPYRGDAALHPTTPTPKIAVDNAGPSPARPNGATVAQSRNIGFVYSGYGVNYTRTLPNGIYNPVVSVAAPNAHGSGVSLVKAGAGTTNQTLQDVGTFRSATGSGGFGTYVLRQLNALDGTPAAIYVNGPGGSNTVTLRWTLGLPGYSGFVLNASWMALVPMTNVPPAIVMVSPANGANGVNQSGQLVFTVQAYDRPVNPGSIVLQFNGSTVTPTVSGPDSSRVTTVSYSFSGLAYTSTNTYSLSLADTGVPAPVVTKSISGSFVVRPQPPTASFTYGPASGTAPLTVSFTNTSPSGFATALWTFGDGGTSTSTNSVVSHTYTVAPSTNTVTLMVADVFNGSGSMTVNNAVTVAPASTSVSFQRAGGQLILTWNQGVLLQATNVAGPWVPNPSATSPFTNDMNLPKMFYRVQISP